MSDAGGLSDILANPADIVDPAAIVAAHGLIGVGVEPRDSPAATAIGQPQGPMRSDRIAPMTR